MALTVGINRLALQSHLWRTDACAGREKAPSTEQAARRKKQQKLNPQPLEGLRGAERIQDTSPLKIIAEASLESHQWQWGWTDMHAHKRPSSTNVELEKAPVPRSELSCAIEPLSTKDGDWQCCQQTDFTSQ